MKAIIDANIATALLTDLAYSRAAHAEVGKAEELIAPELILSETANAFWKIAKATQLPPGYLHAAITFLPSLIDTLVGAKELIAEALQLATAHNHPVYDCQYLVTAQQHDGVLITADRKLFMLAEKSGLKSVLVLPD
jgi:predicted nucleic acid-binding protein